MNKVSRSMVRGAYTNRGEIIRHKERIDDYDENNLYIGTVVEFWWEIDYTFFVLASVAGKVAQ